MTILMEDGAEVETGTIGNEGMIGLSVAQASISARTKAISQISGEGLLIPVSAFLKAMKRGGTSTARVAVHRIFPCGMRTRRSPATCCIRWNSGCAGGC